jgi:hypothetical protein
MKKSLKLLAAAVILAAASYGGYTLYLQKNSPTALRAKAFVAYLQPKVVDLKFTETREAAGETRLSNVTFAKPIQGGRAEYSIEQARFLPQTFAAFSNITLSPNKAISVKIGKVTIKDYQEKDAFPIKANATVEGVTFSGKNIDDLFLRVKAAEVMLGDKAPDIAGLTKTVLKSLETFSLAGDYTYDVTTRTVHVASNIELPDFFGFSIKTNIVNVTPEAAKALESKLKELSKTSAADVQAELAKREALDVAFKDVSFKTSTISFANKGVLQRGISLYATSQKVSEEDARKQALASLEQSSLAKTNLEKPSGFESVKTSVAALINGEKQTLIIDIIKRDKPDAAAAVAAGDPFFQDYEIKARAE